MYRFPKSLSMSIDIVQSLFTVLIDYLYQLLSSPAVTHTDTRLLAQISFGFIVVGEISLFCASTRFKVIISVIKASNSLSIIISYRVAQQLRTPLEIFCFEFCCLSGILSRRIFQIQELSFQSCHHSTCQTPGSSHW